MSKFLKAQLIWVAMTAPLAASIVLGNGGLLTVAVVAAWVYIAYLLLGILGVACLVSGIGKDKDGKAIAELVAYLDARSWLRKAWSWAQSISLVAGLAYAGAGFTAFCLAILVGILQLLLTIARERLKGVQA